MAGFWYALGRWFGGFRAKASAVTPPPPISVPPAAAPPIPVPKPVPPVISAPPAVASLSVPNASPSVYNFRLRPGETYTVPQDVSEDERREVEEFLRTREALQGLLNTGFRRGLPRETHYSNAQEVKRLLEHFRAMTSRHPGLVLTNADQIWQIAEDMELWTQPLHSKQSSTATLVALIDTETTGLEEHDEPLSVAAILLEVESATGETLREVDTYHGFREPKVPIHPRAQAVHGLTLEQLRGRSWDVQRLRKIIDSAELLVAHNAKFDRRMLGKLMPHVVELRWACTMYSLKYEWAKLTEGQWALDAICAKLQVQKPLRHEAMADCVALRKVLAMRSGKTKRSKLLMAKLLQNPWAPNP